MLLTTAIFSLIAEGCTSSDKKTQPQNAFIKQSSDMDSAAGTNEKVGFSPWCPFLISNSFQKLKELAKKIKKIGKDDPRRVFHSLKVGLALTLISIFYYVNPLFNGLGASTMWAVLTVVVVMEYTVGMISAILNYHLIFTT